MPLPTKVKNQVLLMKLAIEQADMIESLESLKPILLNEDKGVFDTLKNTLHSAYTDTIGMLAETMFEIAKLN